MRNTKALQIVLAALALAAFAAGGASASSPPATQEASGAHGTAPAHGDAAPAEAHAEPAPVDAPALGATGHGEDTHGGASHGVAEAGDSAHGAGAHGEDAHGEGGHGGHPPTLVSIAAALLRGGGHEETRASAGIMRFQAQIFAALVSILLITVLSAVARRRSDHPSRLQVAVEMIFDGLYGLIRSVIGPSARRYTPYLGTLFLFILFNNLAGLVPFLYAATSVLNTTAALAICTFLYVQSIGVRENGILGYLHHMAGSPRSGLEWGFAPFMFPLHLLGEFIKPLSLSLRLYGNIFGEETLTATFIVLGAGILAGLHLPFGLPIQIPIMFLGMLTSTIQALVFTLLSTVYIALMLPHHDHEHGHGEAHAH